MATYFVSPTGNNASAGTSTGTAWQTVQKAWDTVANGDTITLMAGTWTGAALACLLSDNSGTNKTPADVLITTATGAAVVFSITARTGKGHPLVGSIWTFKNPVRTTITPGSGGSITFRDTGSQVPAYDSHPQVWDGVAGSGPDKPAAIHIWKTNSSTGHNVLIDGITVDRYTGNGVHIQGANGCNVNNCDISGCMTGVRWSGGDGGGCFNTHVHHNSLMGKDSPQGGDDFGGMGMSIGLGAFNQVIDSCEINDNYSDHSYDYNLDGGGVELYQAATNSNIEIKNCLFHDNHGVIETGTGSGTQQNGGWRFHHNRVYGRADQKNTVGTQSTAPFILLRACPNAEIDHNDFDVTATADGNSGFRWDQAGGFVGNINGVHIHDNIIRVRPLDSLGAPWTSGTQFGYPVYNLGTLPIPAGTVLDHNLIYYTFNYTSNVFKSASLNYTLDSGGAANSGAGRATAAAGTGMLAGDLWGDNNQTGPSRDPLFVSVSTPDYHLSAGSPAIGTASDGGAMGALAFVSGSTLKTITDSLVVSDVISAGPTPFNSVLTDDYARTTALTDSVFNPGTPFQGAPILGVVQGVSASNVNGSAMVHRLNALNQTTRYVYDGVLAKDVRIVKRFMLDQLPSSGTSQMAWMARASTYDNSSYGAQVFISSAGALTGNFFVRDGAGVQTAILTASAFPNAPPAYVAGTWYFLVFECIGDTPTTLRMKLYRQGDGEPTTWGFSTTDAAGPTTAGRIGARFASGAAATPLPRTFTEDTLPGVRVIATDPLTLQDTTTITDTVTQDQQQSFVVTDSISVADGIDDLDGLLASYSLTDSVAVTDFVTQGSGGTITDAVTISDAIGFRSMQITDSLVVSDDITVFGIPVADVSQLTQLIARIVVNGTDTSVVVPDDVLAQAADAIKGSPTAPLPLMAVITVRDSDNLTSTLVPPVAVDPNVYGQMRALTTDAASMTAFVTTAAPADTFTRTVSGDWGTADAGGDWTIESGNISEFDVSGSEGTITMASAALYRAVLAATAFANITATVKFKTDGVTAGNTLAVGLMLRHINLGNYYAFSFYANVDHSVRVKILKSVAGAGTVIADAPTSLVHGQGTYYWMRAQAALSGGTSTLQMRLWADGTAEPAAWTITATDTTAILQAPGAIGVRVQNPGALFIPLVAFFDNLTTTSP